MGLESIGKREVMLALANKANRLRATGTGVNILMVASYSMQEVGGAKGYILELDSPIQFDVPSGSAGRSITSLNIESTTSPTGVVYSIDVSAEDYTFEQVGGRLTASELEVFIDE